MSDSITFFSDTIGKDAGIDWGFEHLMSLRHSVCVDIVKNSDTGHNDEEYGLVFKAKNGTIRTAWIMRDPEGNGAGHLDIIATPVEVK
jgi:hypothetical protein